MHYGIILNILVTSYFLNRIKIVILEELLYCEMNYFYPIMKNIAILLTAIHIWLLKRFKYALKIPNLLKTQKPEKVLNTIGTLEPTVTWTGSISLGPIFQSFTISLFEPFFVALGNFELAWFFCNDKISWYENKVEILLIC